MRREPALLVPTLTGAVVTTSGTIETLGKQAIVGGFGPGGFAHFSPRRGSMGQAMQEERLQSRKDAGSRARAGVLTLAFRDLP